MADMLLNNRLKQETATLQGFGEAISKLGWVLYENVLDDDFVLEINEELSKAYDVRRVIQIQNGLEDETQGTLHHLLERENFAMKLLRRKLFDEEIKSFLDGHYILNSFGGVLNSSDSSSYVQNIHRDVRSFTGDLKFMINMLVMLDDFTLENGATYLLSRSHKEPQKPGDALFFQNADRAVAQRGSVILFDSHLWHATGKNYSRGLRRALTLTFTRPFIKQQLDYPRYIGYEYGESLPEALRQIIGYNARVPATLEEFYQPPQKRMYKPGQG